MMIVIIIQFHDQKIQFHDDWMNAKFLLQLHILNVINESSNLLQACAAGSKEPEGTNALEKLVKNKTLETDANVIEATIGCLQQVRRSNQHRIKCHRILSLSKSWSCNLSKSYQTVMKSQIMKSQIMKSEIMKSQIVRFSPSISNLPKLRSALSL